MAAPLDAISAAIKAQQAAKAMAWELCRPNVDWHAVMEMADDLQLQLHAIGRAARLLEPVAGEHYEAGILAYMQGLHFGTRTDTLAQPR